MRKTLRSASRTSRARKRSRSGALMAPSSTIGATILIGLCAIFVFLTERTTWGRHVFAVGGNDEASRRSGIRVTRVRYSVCHHGAIGGWFDTEWRWMANPTESGCGGFGDLGTHGLDILLWWMGEIESATGRQWPYGTFLRQTFMCLGFEPSMSHYILFPTCPWRPQNSEHFAV